MVSNPTKRIPSGRKSACRPCLTCRVGTAWLYRCAAWAAIAMATASASAAAPDTEHALTVRNPQRLPTTLPVERVAIGTADDYKPSLVQLPSGELLLVAFHQHALKGDSRGPVREDMILFRSGDDGRTWLEPQTLDLLGREPYFSWTPAGTLFLTVHFLERDVRNPHGYLHSYVHRSPDGGATWSTIPVLSQDIPNAEIKAWTHTSRNVLPLADGTLILGVSTPRGNDYLWRSHDGGVTWDQSLRCVIEGLNTEKVYWPFWAETVFWQARNGDLLAIARVDSKVYALNHEKVPEGHGDQSERLVVLRSRDDGAHWSMDRPLGSTYGEMYPAILRLSDGKLLLTITVRAIHAPLGVQAVFGVETDDGFEFDFQHDRVVIDQKTPNGQKSGGGFGPTLQVAGQGLVTAYSYRDGEGKTHLEVARWQLPQ